VFIRDQHLTVQLTGNTAVVTVTFTVILLPDDLTLLLGFQETVRLSAPLTAITMEKRGSLPIESATQPSPAADFRELARRHTFIVPRSPSGFFTTVRFHAHIEIWPGVKRHDIRDTNEGVLPARFTLTFVVAQVTLIVGRFLRALFGR
jgi:hypothetical protein